MFSIDRLDARLLHLLSRDSRMGVGGLATTVGVARNTVQARLRRLTESGVLRGFRPDIDLSAAGLGVEAFLALEIDQGELQAIVRSLAEIPQVLEAHATTGREDLLVRIATDTQSSLQQLIERIVALHGVRHSSTTLALTTPLPYRINPLLNEMAQHAGWGRSTPHLTTMQPGHLARD
jgi:DNA-binding Lrp family transcriptional regulator